MKVINGIIKYNLWQTPYTAFGKLLELSYN